MILLRNLQDKSIFKMGMAGFSDTLIPTTDYTNAASQQNAVSNVNVTLRTRLILLTPELSPSAHAA
jgi:hypothetical protein